MISKRFNSNYHIVLSFVSTLLQRENYHNKTELLICVHQNMSNKVQQYFLEKNINSNSFFFLIEFTFAILKTKRIRMYFPRCINSSRVIMIAKRVIILTCMSINNIDGCQANSNNCIRI